MEITFKTDGSVENTMVVIDGKEIKKLDHGTFWFESPKTEGDYNYKGHISVSWSTLEEADEGLMKRTIYRYSPQDSDDVKSISIVNITPNDLQDSEEYAHYLLTGEIPPTVKDKLGTNVYINRATIPTGKLISINDKAKEHIHVAEVDSNGNGRTTSELGHYHTITNWQLSDEGHTHTLPLPDEG